MFIEQKALLRSLDQISGIIESMDRRFMLKAIGSFSCRLPAEAQANRLIELTERKKILLILRLDIFEALRALKPEYRRILAEKYGFDEEKRGVTDEKNRSYYKKLALATGKFVKALESGGLTAEKIRTLATAFHFLSEAIAVEKSHSISAANFGALKNTSGKSFKPAAPKPEETEQTGTGQTETGQTGTGQTETGQTGTEQTETKQTGTDRSETERAGTDRSETERAGTEISAAARTAESESNA